MLIKKAKALFCFSLVLPLSITPSAEDSSLFCRKLSIKITQLALLAAPLMMFDRKTPTQDFLLFTFLLPIKTDLKTLPLRWLGLQSWKHLGNFSSMKQHVYLPKKNKRPHFRTLCPLVRHGIKELLNYAFLQNAALQILLI